jgi:hypothetical protein
MKGCSLSLAIPLTALHIAAQQPSFDVQTADGQTTFAIDDPIVLNLTIATPADGLFVVAPWASPRGGEFDLDTAAASPAIGWSDPLAPYFKQGMLRTGHGWSWPPLEQAKPVCPSLTLNQWVRFDEPGDYTVTITTHTAFPAPPTTRIGPLRVRQSSCASSPRPLSGRRPAPPRFAPSCR